MSLIAGLGIWAVAGNIGTASNPAVRFDNDATTGLFSPGIGTLAISTNGTEAFRIDSLGKVGIGTIPVASLDVNGGIKIGNDTNCTATKAGTIRYTGGTPAYSYCNGSAWTPFDSAAGGGCAGSDGVDALPFDNGVWGDGAYIYGVDGTYLYAYQGPPPLVSKGSIAYANSSYVWGDGTYIYTANGGKAVAAYTFNGSAFTLKGTVSVSNNVTGLYSDGAYLYISNGSRLAAFTFDGTAFTSKGSMNSSGATFRQVTGSSASYLYAGAATKALALTFNGTSFSTKATQTDYGNYAGATSDGTYVYFSDTYGCTEALSFNGSSFTTVKNDCDINTNGAYGGVFLLTNNGYIYSQSGYGTKVYTFNGTIFTPKQTFTVYSSPRNIWIDNNYLYVADTTFGAYVFPRCQ